ncbi:hypothetical protein AALO_G00105190 [Alosa alosa]|uniref:Uncharacterized protein n=1 Tax=Alosa alosa TaxID=278164 RepID=A0AAV6GVR5_9TELE|nr:hypothetical protein AALO_G00105190 [Alosa alosa]
MHPVYEWLRMGSDYHSRGIFFGIIYLHRGLLLVSERVVLPRETDKLWKNPHPDTLTYFLLKTPEALGHQP